MALIRHLKNIFIVPKHRLMQLFQIVENHKTKNYSVLQNFAERGYLLSTASGNLVRSSYKAIAEGGKRHSFVAFLHSAMLPQTVVLRFEVEEKKRIKKCKTLIRKNKMKKYIIAVIFTIFLLLNSAIADPYDCGDGCTEVQNPPFTTEIFPGCTAIINYASGDCPDGKCRIRITNIHFQGNCSQFTINELINLSAIRLIEQWQIKTACSDQEEPVKLMDVYMAPCMKWVGNLGTNGIDATLVPC